MKMFAKTAAAVALSAAMMSAVTIDTAEASRRGRVAVGVGVGILAGAAIAGAAAASSRGDVVVRERVYAPRDCGEFRRQARYNEDIGRPSRAAYWWDRYEACRGGY
jgi:hypothetical protein